MGPEFCERLADFIQTCLDLLEISFTLVELFLYSLDVFLPFPEDVLVCCRTLFRLVLQILLLVLDLAPEVFQTVCGLHPCQSAREILSGKLSKEMPCRAPACTRAHYSHVAQYTGCTFRGCAPQAPCIPGGWPSGPLHCGGRFLDPVHSRGRCPLDRLHGSMDVRGSGYMC